MALPFNQGTSPYGTGYPNPVNGNGGRVQAQGIALSVILQGASLILTCTNVAPNQYAIVIFRIMFIPATLNQTASATGVLANGLTFVVDIQAYGQKTVTATVPVAPYAQGGWMYALGLASPTDPRGALTTSVPVRVPTLTFGSVPSVEVTNPTVNRIIFSRGGFTFNTLQCTCNAPTTAGTLNTFGELFIVIFNYFNDGLYRHLGSVPYTSVTLPPGVGGDAISGNFTLECDDGTGGPSNPGAHACKIFFLAASSSGNYRQDFAAGSPNVNLATGIHS